MNYLNDNKTAREEIRKLCKERDSKLKKHQMPTIITDAEMRNRERLNLPKEGYITYKDFQKKVLLTNPHFMLTKKTLQQKLDDIAFKKEMENRSAIV